MPLLTLAACQTDDDAPAPLMPAGTSAAVYRVTFTATWSAATHANFPAGAHFSPIIGLSHRAGALIFQPGRPSSLGIQNMAELGVNTALRTEIAALQASGAALARLDGRGLPSPGSVSGDTIRLDAAHPRLTLVTMIAPSPDWFVALEDEALLGPDGQWAAQRTVPARAYDAGTDSGPTFTSPNQATTPAEPIRPLVLAPAAGPAPDGPPLGTWQLERVR